MSTTTTTALVSGTQPLKANKRVQLETLIREFQTKLGNDWDKYHESLTSFLIGKLSRPELVSIISPLLKNGLVKYHNKLLLLNFANSLQDSPVEFSSELASFWSKKNAKTKNVKSTQYEKFKQNIMGLPLKERRRIRSITKESGKKNKLSASITLTRQALLPKIPMIQDKEQQQLQVNNLVQWQQDVVNGINTPLATSTYELPDYDNLSRRMLMTMREHGLTGGVSSRALEMVSLGLESHLKNIVESAMDLARYREHKYAPKDFLQSGLANSNGFLNGSDNPKSFGVSRKRKREELASSSKTKEVAINIEDMFNTLEMFPHLIEPCGPKYRLTNVLFQNDDMMSEFGYTLPPRPVPPPEEARLNGTLKGVKNEGEANGTTEENGPMTDKSEQPTKQQPKLQNDTSHMGTVDELKWVLHDLISTM